MTTPFETIDADLVRLNAAKDAWARTDVPTRIALLDAVADQVAEVAQAWVMSAARRKGLDPNSTVAGEEWLAGPQAVLAGLRALAETLRAVDDKRFLEDRSFRTLPSGAVALEVFPVSIWDRLLLSGITAEVAFENGLDEIAIRRAAAAAYDVPPSERKGRLALVLGAGNVDAIAPLDVVYKLFVENEVAVLKMNPLNADLTPCLARAFAPLIARDALAIVEGGADVGAYLAEHPLVETLHVTGAEATHDAIVWGTGAEAEENRRAGTPKNSRPFTSELGCVSPVIVVPGDWNPADLRFQAEHIATMKLNNAGHNCIAAQVLIVPQDWSLTDRLLSEVERVIGRNGRRAWYSGTDTRLDAFAPEGPDRTVPREGARPLAVIEAQAGDAALDVEVFGPGLAILRLSGSDPAVFLREAIAVANHQLRGTLGANVLIHPATERAMGPDAFDAALEDMRYGTVGVNCWTGVGFSLPTCPWGAYPGHDINDIQSGQGVVHNALMLSGTTRTVVRGPWRPFPRSVFAGDATLLPKPPHFLSHRQQRRVGEALTRFRHRPGVARALAVVMAALRG